MSPCRQAWHCGGVVVKDNENKLFYLVAACSAALYVRVLMKGSGSRNKIAARCCLVILSPTSHRTVVVVGGD